MKKSKILLIILLMIFPLNIYAYSDKVIVGGETIGIEVYSKGVYVVGFYEVDGKNIASDAGFKIGDIITKINNNDINNIHGLNDILKDDNTYTFKVLRNNKYLDISMKLEEIDNTLKTGLYVKDRINGIGTLSYIDPNTLVFGSLGHEIIESNSFLKFEINEGFIYSASVSEIRKSINGNAGSKNANVDKESDIGIIKSNEIEGIFGKYKDSFSNKELIEVGNNKDIKKGKAYIKTVIEDNKIEDFSINILTIDESSDTKNILFEITDEKLLKKTGGIVQGMSGSPIIQNNKLIGVVNYVIVDSTNKGYGIFITKMLEEGDKIIS